MRANSKEPQPVRLANPTAESFVASLKVVHFFAIFFFWLVLVSLLLHVATFIVFQSGGFDGALGLRSAMVDEPEDDDEEKGVSSPADVSGPPADTTKTPAGDPEPDLDEETDEDAEQTPATVPTAGNQHSLRHVTQLMATMRLVGLLASMLLLVTLFVYLEISLLGRLAGVKYLTMSFFLMLVFVATVYSWEPLLPGASIVGSLYVLDEFLNSYTVYIQRQNTLTLGEVTFHYGRFLVLPICSLALLVFSWLRFRKGYEESVLMNE